ncbi:MAG: DnaA N-terminal domain-containing protein, partial [Candidatus Dormibacteraceae bacterium]
MNAWQEVLSYLKTKVNTQSYQTWLRPTRLSRVENDSLVVQVPNREFQDWIQEHYGRLVQNALDELDLGYRRVAYVIE